MDADHRLGRAVHVAAATLSPIHSTLVTPGPEVLIVTDLTDDPGELEVIFELSGCDNNYRKSVSSKSKEIIIERGLLHVLFSDVPETGRYTLTAMQSENGKRRLLFDQRPFDQLSISDAEETEASTDYLPALDTPAQDFGKIRS